MKEEYMFLRVRYLLRLYERLKEEYNQKNEEVDCITALSDGLPRGSSISNKTEKRAVVLAELQQQISAIETIINKAMDKIPLTVREIILKELSQDISSTKHKNTEISFSSELYELHKYQFVKNVCNIIHNK